MTDRIQAITAARVVDGTGAPPLADAVVIIENERITAVGTRADIPLPPNAEVLDLGAHTLLPGLIDAHTHFYLAGMNSLQLRAIEPPQRKLIRAVVDVARLLEAGFTAVRDLGARDPIYIKQAIEAGEIPGPRMSVPIMMIVQTGGSPDPYWLPVEWVEAYDYRCRLADGVDEVRKAAREQIRAGADFLKIMASGGLGDRQGLRNTYHYTLDELKAIVEEGHKVGLSVAAHAVGAPAVKNVVLAGVDTVEHGSYADDEALDLMAERDVIFVPTLGVLQAFANGPAGHARNLACEAYEAGLSTVARARERGVRIAAGTDFGGVPMTRHGENAIEAELLTEAGLTPDEAIVAITKRGAEAMARQHEIGTIEVGKYADLIATETNPLESIRALREVSFVMKGGQVVRNETTASAKEDRRG